MISWPDLQLPPINLWSLPYVNQSRRREFGMEERSIPKSGQSRDTGNRKWIRSAHSQSTNLWATIQTYR